jgi:hypothetical protein
MRLKALLLACAVAGFTASFALADDGGHHGKHSTTTTMTTATTTAAANACAEVELRGTLGTVAPTSFTLTVARQDVREDEDDNDDDNAATPAVPNLVGQTVTIAVAPDTRVSFKAVGALRGPATGDTANVNALACGTPMTLTAKSVKAQPATAAGAQSSSKSHR